MPSGRAWPHSPWSAPYRDIDARIQAIAKRLREEVLRGDFEFPMLSSSVLEILHAATQPDLSLRALESVIRCDQAVSVRVLHCANSALYQARFQTSSLHAAALRLGAEALRELMARAVAEAVIFKDGQGPAKVLQREREHAVHTAILSRRACELSGRSPDCAYLCGLLHDVGRPLLWTRLHRSDWAHEFRDLGIDVLEQVVELLHPLVGERVLRRWLMPPITAEVARFHHCFRGSGNAADHKSMVCVVAASDRLAHRIVSKGATDFESFLSDPAMVELDLDPDAASRWFETASQLADERDELTIQDVA